MARYGDYVKWRLGDLRLRSRERKSVGYQRLGGKFRWSKINQSLKEERLDLENCGAETKPLRPVTMAVLNACDALNFDSSEVFLAIDLYATRNEAVHADIEAMIKKCQWGRLGPVLYRDLQELLLTIPPSMPETLTMMTSTIETLRDRYFDLSRSSDPDDPSTWHHTAKVYRIVDVLSYSSHI